MCVEIVGTNVEGYSPNAIGREGEQQQMVFKNLGEKGEL
jgi:hypothetical protein